MSKKNKKDLYPKIKGSEIKIHDDHDLLGQNIKTKKENLSLHEKSSKCRKKDLDDSL